MPTTALKSVEPELPNRQDAGSIMESVIAKGDLSQLKPEERARYYLELCRSLGINELTQPFQYITLNGKLTLYATRTATDQLRKENDVSLEIIDRRREDDLYIVVAKATMPLATMMHGERIDESTGAVSIKGLQGDALANAYMKAETKAKRRVTLSICGLGWMDESETVTVPTARPVDVDIESGVIADVGDSGQEPPPPKGELVEPANVAPFNADINRMQRLHGVAATKGLSHDELHLIAVGRGKASLKDLTPQEMDTLTNWLAEKAEPPAIQKAIDAGREVELAAR